MADEKTCVKTLHPNYDPASSERKWSSSWVHARFGV